MPSPRASHHSSPSLLLDATFLGVFLGVLLAMALYTDLTSARASGGSARALDLALERVVKRRVVQAAGEGVRARGQHEPRVRARVAAGHCGQVPERLE